MVSDQESFGGAAVAASRLAEGLCESGHEVVRLVEQVDGADHPWRTVRWEEELRVRHKMLTRAGRRPKGLYDRSAEREFETIVEGLAPDIINLHNLHSAAGSGWSPRFLAAAARHAPVVWTLHDMWSFTGRCAYSYSCRKFLTGCDETCPTPFEDPVLDANKISGSWALRREIFSSDADVHAVCPSRWLATEASQGFWDPARVSVIPYGLGLDVFRPVDRSVARGVLDLPTDRPLLLAAAQDLNDRRKGKSLLETALGHVDGPLGVVTLGTATTLRTRPDVSLHNLGYIHAEADRALAFNAADVLVHPAIADNLPNTVLEAISCGTPVVGFQVGGVIDMVVPGSTGWLAREVSADALAETIQVALRDIADDPMRASCRKVAEGNYGQERQADAYIDLFHRVLGHPLPPVSTTV